MHSPVKPYAGRPNAQILIGTRIHGLCIYAYSSIRIDEKMFDCRQLPDNYRHGHARSFENVESKFRSGEGREPIEIGDYVWISANVVILPGVRYGTREYCRECGNWEHSSDGCCG